MENLKIQNLKANIKDNWKSGLTVAFISVPLSIALSIASGAGPLPGLIAGIWGTLIGSIFIGSNYNIIGAAGALTTVLFTTTLTAPLGLGAQVLPLLAIITGAIIFFIWLLKLDRFLYYIPTNVMYGFATGVAILIAASQLFDATGLSNLTRTGHFLGDIEKFVANSHSVDLLSLGVFVTFFIGILLWKKFFAKIPAVIPIAVLGIIFGYLNTVFFNLELISLQDKFGAIGATLILPIDWNALVNIVTTATLLKPILEIASLIALIAVLETLITAKLGDKLTKTESSSSRELLGLALANFGSGFMGGLPATGVFLRTGANIKAGATHRTSGIIAAIITGFIALLVLPFFSYIPMVVIAAILVNTALGLLGIDELKHYWKLERQSFAVAILVAIITVFHDAGLAVGIGAIVALLLFARKISHGHFDVTWNFTDGTIKTIRDKKNLKLPTSNKTIKFATYSIAGDIGYIDASRHYHNLKTLTKDITPIVIIRLRDLFSVDLEGGEALADAVIELRNNDIKVLISSASTHIKKELQAFPIFVTLETEHLFTDKTSDAIALITNP